MKSPNRDLLVLLKDESMSSQAIEQEVKKLNSMLMHVEGSDKFLTSHEVLDLNRYKVLRDPAQVRMAAKDNPLKPFIFLSNLN